MTHATMANYVAEFNRTVETLAGFGVTDVQPVKRFSTIPTANKRLAALKAVLTRKQAEAAPPAPPPKPEPTAKAKTGKPKKLRAFRHSSPVHSYRGPFRAGVIKPNTNLARVLAAIGEEKYTLAELTEICGTKTPANTISTAYSAWLATGCGYDRRSDGIFFSCPHPGQKAADYIAIAPSV